jgi:hypothetical protein
VLQVAADSKGKMKVQHIHGWTPLKSPSGDLVFDNVDDDGYPAPHVHVGYLTKMGSVRKNWKRRWFLLDKKSGTLTYFEGEQGETKRGVNEKGFIDMRNVETIEPGDPDVLLIKMTTNDLEVGKMREWQFRSISQEERDEWVAVLTAAQERFGTVGERLSELDRRAQSARASPRWIPNGETAGRCMICAKGFTNQRHCCYCGWAVCGDCSKGRLVLGRWLSADKPHAVQNSWSKKPLRVCDLCLPKYPAEQAQRDAEARQIREEKAQREAEARRKREEEEQRQRERETAERESLTVTGSHVTSLNTIYKPQGMFDGFPLYRSINDTPGLYYHTETSNWMFNAAYTEEAATKGIAHSAIVSKDGTVPLGAHTWRSWIDEEWQELTITISGGSALVGAQHAAQKRREQQRRAAEDQRQREMEAQKAAAEARAALQRAMEAEGLAAADQEAVLRSGVKNVQQFEAMREDDFRACGVDMAACQQALLRAEMEQKWLTATDQAKLIKGGVTTVVMFRQLDGRDFAGLGIDLVARQFAARGAISVEGKATIAKTGFTLDELHALDEQGIQQLGLTVMDGHHLRALLEQERERREEQRREEQRRWEQRREAVPPAARQRAKCQSGAKTCTCGGGCKCRWCGQALPTSGTRSCKSCPCPCLPEPAGWWPARNAQFARDCRERRWT